MAKRKPKPKPLVEWSWKNVQVSGCGNRLWTSDCGKFQIVEFARYHDIPMEHTQWTVWQMWCFKGVEKAHFIHVGDKASRKQAVALCEKRRAAYIIGE